jgi:hypothetical protein
VADPWPRHRRLSGRSDRDLDRLAVIDGLYRVTTPYLCAGFVVENGRVTACAPILRRKLGYWQTVAVRVG